MNNKVRVLLVILGIVSLLGVALSVWIYFSAQEEFIKQEEAQAKLEDENSYLKREVNSAQKESLYWQDRTKAVTETLNRLGQNYTALQNEYGSLQKERNELLNQTRSLNAEIKKLNQLYLQAQQEPKSEKTDKYLNRLLEERATLQGEVEKLQAQIEGMKGRIVPYQREDVSVEGEQEKTQLEQQLAGLSRELSREREVRGSLEENLARAESQLDKMEEERNRLAGQLAEVKQGLQQKLKPGGSIELPPIVVKADLDSIESAAFRKDKGEPVGRVIQVNQKHNFVVVDMGTDDGVKVGTALEVYRDGKQIGRIEAMETRRSIAACEIKNISVKGLKISDAVRP